jgi:hypothetical protein
MIQQIVIKFSSERMMTTGHPEPMPGRAGGRLDASIRQQGRFEHRFATSGSNPVIPFGSGT